MNNAEHHATAGTRPETGRHRYSIGCGIARLVAMVSGISTAIRRGNSGAAISGDGVEYRAAVPLDARAMMLHNRDRASDGFANYMRVHRVLGERRK